MPKNLVLCCDGTNNQFDGYHTNVIRPVGVQDVKNVWFAGVHSDVGGGYQPDEAGLARVAFEWMMREARAFNLDVDDAALDRELRQVGEVPNPNGKLHRSLHGGWWAGEMLPMKHYNWDDHEWHWRWLAGAFDQSRNVLRNAGNSFVSIHRSVIERLKGPTNYRPVNIPNDEETLRSKFQVED